MVNPDTQWAKASNYSAVEESFEKRLSNLKRLFGQRPMVIATMHGKQHAMQPLIRKYLGLDNVIIPDFDTDEFGTFSGEIERVLSPVDTLRKKIMKALAVANETLGIGNEGSFGAHPKIPFVQANQEIVMLIDLENNIEIVEQIISTETNHGHRQINGKRDLIEFADSVKFPSHAIILKQMKDGVVINMRKGILTWEYLHATSSRFTSPDTTLIAETDMRAYLNPTRMKNIEKATEELLKKVTNLCPQCQWPGFGAVERVSGLPCSACNKPTNMTWYTIYQCKNCGYADERYNQNRSASPEYCDHCNP